MHAAQDIIHIANRTNLEFFTDIIEIEAGAADQQFYAPLNQLLQMLYGIWVSRGQLNAIVHPAVKQEILRRIEQAKLENVSYTVVEAALFLEENYDAFCNETWYIYTSEDNRRLRLKASRGYSDEKIDRMFAAQKSHEEFLERCQFVIDNNVSAQETHRQIDRRMRHT